MNRYTSISIAKNENSNVANIGARYYVTNFYPSIPLNSNDIYAITDFGDRLDILANQFYGDPSLYWIIASANPDVVRPDSLSLNGGIQLRIPVDINGILSSYTAENGIGSTLAPSPVGTAASTARGGSISSGTGGGGGGGY